MSIAMQVASALVLFAANCISGGAIAVQSGTTDASKLHDFSKYVETFGRSYQRGTEEYETRQAIFNRNIRRIQAQNSLSEQSWTAGVNLLTDRTDEELNNLLGWRRTGKKRSGLAMLSEGAQALPAPPDVVDWTNLSMALDVPDQGSCGSCWAVATVSMLQARYEVKMSGTRTFSAQQLVNCVPNPKECGGSGGCSGATVELAMDYILKKGLVEEFEEPYVGRDMACPSSLSLAARSPSFLGTRDNTRAEFGLQTWRTLPENKALPLMRAVADGPVAISVSADAWFHYAAGVFDGCKRNSVINHATVLFGYGIDSSTGKHFWNIRNSWGPYWGERGFIRLLRHDTAEKDDEYCGTDYDPSAGVACKPYPNTVKICGTCGLLYDSVAASLSSMRT